MLFTLIYNVGKSKIRDSLISDTEKRRVRTTQQKKTSFRNTSIWQKFRKFRKRQDKVDYITQSPLTVKWSLHHMDLNPNHYTDISNPSYFVALNNGTHDIVHQLYPFYIEDPTCIDRLKEVLEKMKEINESNPDTATIVPEYCSVVYEKEGIFTDET